LEVIVDCSRERASLLYRTGSSSFWQPARDAIELPANEQEIHLMAQERMTLYASGLTLPEPEVGSAPTRKVLEAKQEIVISLPGGSPSVAQPALLCLNDDCLKAKKIIRLAKKPAGDLGS
jgi:hypothetical protein